MFDLFKFLHVVGVVVWVGGVVTMSLLVGRASKQEGLSDLLAVSRQTAYFGQRVLGPAAVVTLIAGIATTVAGDIPFQALWVTWGFVAIIVSMGMGGTVIRRANVELVRLASSGSPDHGAVQAVRQRVQTLAALNIALLLSAIAAMVVKPDL